MSKRAVFVALACILVSGCELLVSLPGSDGVLPPQEAGSDASGAGDGTADAPGDVVSERGLCDGPCGATPTSCFTPAWGKTSGCGITRAESCCAINPVPGGDFFRGNRNGDPTAKARVSPYALDRYEITVARFKQFIADGYGLRNRAPQPGFGASPRTPGSGWLAEFDSRLDDTPQELQDQLLCTRHDVDCVGPAFTYGSVVENIPIVDVPWVVAFWFCAWDGGRLPTEAEWEFAAVGGNEQRDYPWAEKLPPDISRAAYGCTFGELDASPTCTVEKYATPGTLGAGIGRWGHYDLAGNAAEWVLDTYHAAYPDSCVDCAATDVTVDSYLKVYRGGSIGSQPAELRNDQRAYGPMGYTRDGVGFRCARDL